MKRVVAVMVLLILAVSVLAGCGAQASGQYKDGTYKASFDKLDAHGYKAFTEVTIQGGKITAAVFDYTDKDNNLKSKSADYEKSMKAKNNIGPVEYSAQLPKALIEKQDPAKVDAITGATDSSKNFKELVTAALEKAKTGDTSEAVLPQKE